MKRGIAIFVFIIILVSPFFASAHQSGCHRWHTCPSDTGSYQMQTNPDTGKVIPFCGKSMYLDTDGKCHYYTTKNAPPPVVNKPSSLQQANVAENAKQAKIAELKRQIQVLLQQLNFLQVQLADEMKK